MLKFSLYFKSFTYRIFHFPLFNFILTTNSSVFSLMLLFLAMCILYTALWLVQRQSLSQFVSFLSINDL